MPVIIRRLLDLLPLNPICLRLVGNGSRRVRHLTLRAGYLGLLMLLLLIVLAGRFESLRDLAQAGASAFTVISFGQVFLICLLTPVFMAGAIAQEANEETWNILLTTPLNGLQIVLGNLFGRLFFILALLLSTLPLFATLQYFGGVPTAAIFSSFAIAACSALIVAAIAVTLSVTRTAGRRAVFIFYVTVVMYLFVTWSLDFLLRTPVSPGVSRTTVLTPLNPFLALEAQLLPRRYVAETDPGAFGLARLWFEHPVATFCWGAAILSLGLVLFSTVRLRVIGARAGVIPWHRKLFGRGFASGRPPRHVGQNPIAWWEREGRGNTLVARLGRWTFVLVGVATAVVLLGVYHGGGMTAGTFQIAFATVLVAETVIIALTALNLSATAVAREREDGTLDLILTTPIQPGPYLAGKLRGIIQNLLPMLLVPMISVMLAAAFVLLGGFGAATSVTVVRPGAPIEVQLVLPELALVLPPLLVAFTSFAVMVGLHWSIRSKGTIGSITAAVAVVLVVAGLIGFCGAASGGSIEVVGAFLSALSPVNLVLAGTVPQSAISGSIEDLEAARVALVIGALIATIAWCVVVWMMHAGMKRSFMMTVRRLAGVS